LAPLGTRPRWEHIAAIAKALEGQPPRKWGTQPTEKVFPLETEIESSA